MKRTACKTDQNHPQVKTYREAIQKGMQSQHVLPKGDSWAVKRAGAEKVTKVFDTQKEASQYATEIARNQGTAVFIHGEDGRIRDRKDY